MNPGTREEREERVASPYKRDLYSLPQLEEWRDGLDTTGKTKYYKGLGSWRFLGVAQGLPRSKSRKKSVVRKKDAARFLLGARVGGCDPSVHAPPQGTTTQTGRRRQSSGIFELAGRAEAAVQTQHA